MLNVKQELTGFPVRVGVICSANGIKGYVKIKSYTANPEDIVSFKQVYELNTGRQFKLTCIAKKKDILIAKVDGVTNRNDAELLQNIELYIDRSELPEPSKNEFYHADLIGLLVEDTIGVQLGKVTNVMNFGAGDLLEVRNESTNQEQIYPFNKDFVVDVRLDNGVIVVNKVEELIASQD